ncbi:hypothetical protein [Chitinophaga solisilvae]|uniref:hypothetical protein n=1 Tax=Chitinophaga solisilvae TaxID=1233460 RepID=UPI00136E18E7|nr:hypothetical protein [Chitinophaga solisilvae]
MSISKILSRLAFLLLLCTALQVSAQSEKPVITDVTSDILAWVKRLDNGFDKYCTREKAADLKQGFEFFKQDLGVYMKTRKTLSDSLFRHNISPGKKDPDNLETLKVRMSAVMERMRNVSDFVSNDLRQQGDQLSEHIYDVLYGQENNYISALDAFLAGQDVTKKDLAVDGSTRTARLEECVRILASMQEKAERKQR